ncbi:MAG: VCBS repeat-containing protein, partial [Planctomycetes bacterium]|nr:VCBS repeat-containing protein [Planctomycetota bacterium]
MLTVTAVPQDFEARNNGGTEVRFEWLDTYANDVTFEIQASTTGLNSPDLWRDFFKPPVVNTFNAERDAYRSNYYRIRATEVGNTVSPWTDLVDADCTANPVVECPRPTNNPEDNTVKVSAIAHSQIDVPLIAATIELRWPEELAYADADYKVYRKEKDETSFTLKATLTWDGQTTITGWTDENLGNKTAYEYKVERTRKFSPTHAFFAGPLLDFSEPPPYIVPAIGYVYAGVDVPLDDPDSTIESPGTVILVIDETQIDATLSDDVIAEIDRLEQDLIAEGWKVVVIDNVNPNDTIESVRDKIVDKYDDDPTNVKAVFLIGHIPVPMSGLSSPDGHPPPRPMPADVFYGDMGDAQGNSIWDVDAGLLTENTVPDDGDGKPVELMVGRVDMRGLPNFQQYSPGLTEAQLETELLRRYLDKDHVFRTGQVAVERGALIRDQFAKTNSSTGVWQTMSGLFGPAANPSPEVPDNIDVADWPEPIWPLAVGLRSIDSADLDNDGDADFLTASYDDNRIAWYENVGGDLTAQHIISDEVLGASAVIAADLNGDGCDDIVAASSETGEILWYDNDIDIPTGTCQKTFAQQPLIEDPLRGMSSVFAIDLDGDGGVGEDVDIDVIFASADSNTIGWHENLGNEDFTKRIIDTDAQGASSVFAIDLDGDGDIDVLSASANDNKIAWYENDGNENFTKRTIVTNAVGASSVFAIDVNGDGKVDVLSASANDDKITWYENSGSPNFTFTRHDIATDADGASSVFAIDVDGDGDMDVLSASYKDDKVAWYENRLNQQEQDFNPIANVVTTAADGASSVYAINMDGDADIDIVVASKRDDTIAWYENDGSQGFTKRTIASDADGATSVFAIDLDGDGDVDVLGTLAFDDKVIWYENDGSEGFTDHLITYPVDGASAVFAIDVNGDGDIDVLSASKHDDTIAWYKNDGQLTPAFTRDNIRDEPSSLFAADLNGDNDLDVIAALYDSQTIVWYENSGSPNFTFTPHVVATDVLGASSVVAADVDGINGIDIIVTSAIGGKVIWYKNSGSPDYTFTVQAVPIVADGASSVVAADVDGDTDIDFVVTSAADNTVAWYENDGNQVFTKQTIDATFTGASSVFAGDINNDGKIDVLATSQTDNTITWYENDATQSFSTKHVISTSAADARAIHAADLAGDGALEVIGISSSQDHMVAWYESDGTFDEQVAERLPSKSFLWGHAADFGAVWGFNNHEIITTDTLAAPDGVSVVQKRSLHKNRGLMRGVDNSIVFTSFFGSWQMEWQKTDSVLRAILADEGYGLTATWGGTERRPDWGKMFYQHMSLGETVGAGLLNTQNHKAYDNLEDTGVFLSLLGDPTLRMFVVRPPGEVTRVVGPLGVTDVRWEDSPDEEVTGYHVYRSTGPGVAFEWLTEGAPVSSPYQDTNGGVNYSYLVRAVKTETTGGGTFVNLSAGVYSQDPYNHPGLVMNQGTTTDDVALNPNFVGFSSPQVTIEVTFASDIITSGGAAGVPIFSYATNQDPVTFRLFVNSEAENRMILTINGFDKEMAREDVVRDLFDGADHHIAVTYDSATTVA